MFIYKNSMTNQRHAETTVATIRASGAVAIFVNVVPDLFLM